MRDIKELADDIVEDVMKDFGTVTNTGLKAAGAYMVDRLKKAYYFQEMDGPPLAESTVQRKGNDMMLIDTGTMVDKWEYQVVGKELKVGNDYKVSGTAKPLCEIHEDGVRGAGGWRIPARPVIKKTIMAEEDKIEDILVGGVAQIKNEL